MAIKKKAAKKKSVVKKTTKKKSVTTKTVAPPMSEDEKRRADWEVNNELISEAFFTSILRNKKFPTYQSIADKLGLDVKTVQRHLKDDEMFDELKIKMRALSNKAFLTLGIKAMQGTSHHWSRLFFEVMDEVKGKDQTPVVVNNNGGMSDNQFSQLLNTIRGSKANSSK